MNKYTIYLSSGNIADVRADDYFIKGGVYFFHNGQYELSGVLQGDGLIAQFNQDKIEGIINHGK